MPYYLHLNKVYRIGFLFSHISHINNRLLRRKFCLLGMGNFWRLCVFQDCKGSEGPFLSACQVPVKSYPLLNFQKGHESLECKHPAKVKTSINKGISYDWKPSAKGRSSVVCYCDSVFKWHCFLLSLAPLTTVRQSPFT